jgi:feruloyl-CoA synthase
MVLISDLLTSVLRSVSQPLRIHLTGDRHVVVSYALYVKAERGRMPETADQVFAPPRVLAEERDTGVLLLRSAESHGEIAPSMAHVFRRRAREHPDRPLATDLAAGESRELSWGEADDAARSIAQALLENGLTAERPLLVLSGNGFDHLLLLLGAFYAGVPIVPVSSAYSLLSRDHARVRAVAELCSPGMVFADDAVAYEAALESLRELVPLQLISRGERRSALRLDTLRTTPAGVLAQTAFDELTPDTVAKILFTSGSTGTPKGVINTHRMLCVNQAMLGQVWPFLHAEPPVLVDWLPWSHTFGGNHNLGQVLAYGGTLHIDDGRPAPGLFGRTLEALWRVSPTAYFNVPAGYALLVPRLEEDREFAAHFFSRLRFLFYAAAALPPALWDRLQELAAVVCDRAVPLTASWGTTETAPAATSAHFEDSTCGCIGVPLPGVTLKLVPNGGKQEIRVHGPSVTPGYFRNATATDAAFDEEGFYRTGDAVRLVDPDDPSRGLMFDGRLAEDFKLITGTFVHVGRVRTELVSAAGVLSDVVVCGEGCDRVGALAWIDEAAAARQLGGAEVSHDDDTLHAYLARALAEMNRGAGSAMRVERLLLLRTPPDIDLGEVTDKGYINQRKVRELRHADVLRLFAEPVDRAVIAPAAD